MRRRGKSRGQTAVEYMLAVSVLAIAISAAFYQLIGANGSKPMQKSFDRTRGTIEAPYP